MTRYASPNLILKILILPASCSRAARDLLMVPLRLPRGLLVAMNCVLERLATPARLTSSVRCTVLATEKDDVGSETGYERMVLSQVSTTSAVGGSRPKRKCSLVINPIHQLVPSKRLHVDELH